MNRMLAMCPFDAREPLPGLYPVERALKRLAEFSNIDIEELASSADVDAVALEEFLAGYRVLPLATVLRVAQVIRVGVHSRCLEVQEEHRRWKQKHRLAALEVTRKERFQLLTVSERTELTLERRRTYMRSWRLKQREALAAVAG